MGIFKQTIRTMNNVLKTSTSVEDIIGIIPHNPDSFYWNGAQDIAEAFFPK